MHIEYLHGSMEVHTIFETSLQPDLVSITNNQLQLHFQFRLLSEVNYNNNYTVLISQFNYSYNYNYIDSRCDNNSMCYCNSMGGVYQSVCTGAKFKFV